MHRPAIADRSTIPALPGPAGDEVLGRRLLYVPSPVSLTPRGDAAITVALLKHQLEQLDVLDRIGVTSGPTVHTSTTFAPCTPVAGPFGPSGGPHGWTARSRHSGCSQQPLMAPDQGHHDSCQLPWESPLEREAKKGPPDLSGRGAFRS
jgi:hypothetical protein